MKEARYISTLIILALLLGVYDVLCERIHYTAAASLLIVLGLFSVWMVLQFVVVRLIQKSSTPLPEVNPGKHRKPFDDDTTEDADSKYVWKSLSPDQDTKVLRRVKLPQLEAPTPPKSIIDTIPRHAHLKPETRAQVQKIVEELCEVSGIRSASIISTRGDVMVSVPEISAPSTNMAALTVSIFALSLRIMNQFGSSKLEQIIVDGSNGLVYFQSAGEATYIMATVGEEMSRGSVVQEVQRTAKLVAAAIATQS